MPLSPGTRLGPYAIQAPLGAGGMGEVYKARDTRLDRTVAIKVLPEQFAADPTLKQRFEREAQTVAAPNHPHICTLYDIGRAIPQGPHPGPLPDGEGGDGHAATRHEATQPVFVDFLVMEHLEGETLMARVARGPMPVTEAMPLALTLVVTLKVLHEQDVVHRDLKPANLFLTTTPSSARFATSSGSRTGLRGPDNACAPKATVVGGMSSISVTAPCRRCIAKSRPAPSASLRGRLRPSRPW